MSIFKASAWRSRSSIQKLLNYSTAVSEKSTAPSAEPVKVTLREKWKIYWKSLVNDYTEAAKGAVQSAKENPLRSSVLGTTALVAYYSAKKNPDEMSFVNAVRNKHAEMVLVHQSCHRQSSANHLRKLEEAINQKTLRVTSLGLLTIVWMHDFSSELCTYKAICKWLQPDYGTFSARIVDVGFWNKWWNLEKIMTDYDIPEVQS